MGSYEDITFDVVDDGVATLTINRPEVMNALRPQTSAARSSRCSTRSATTMPCAAC